MIQKRNKSTRGYVLILILFCIVLIATGELRTQRYREDFKARAIPVALEKGKTECLKEGISQEECNNLVAEPSSESSECGSQVCWRIYVDAQDKEVYTSSVKVGKGKDKMFVIDYSRSQFKRLQ